MKGILPLMSLWTLVVSQKLVYLEKGSQRTANKMMLAFLVIVAVVVFFVCRF